MDDGSERIPGSQAAELAPTLVGLPEAEARRRATEGGCDPEVVPPGVTAVTMEFRARRIRLFVDESGLVVRASAG